MRTCRPTAGSAPSRLVASRQETLLAGVRPTSHGGVSLGRAMGLWVIAVGARPTDHNCYPQVTKAVRICCALTNIAQLCVLHTFPPSPKKRRLGFNVLRHAKLRKKYSLPGLAPRTFVAHESLLSSCSETGHPTITESTLCTWMVLRSGSGIQGNTTTRHRLPPGRTNKPNPQARP